MDEIARVHRAAHLTDRVIARAVGAAPSTVRDWLAGRSAPTGVRADRVADLAEVVDRLLRRLPADRVALWLAKPNEGLDDHRPLDLLATGDAQRVARAAASIAGQPPAGA